MLRAMHADIISANEAFYAAFREEDAVAMDGLWSQHAPVACVHPGWPALIGREQVMASWRAIGTANGAPPVRCGAARVLMLGEVAQVVCEERVGTNLVIATNVFVREAGHWMMVHHHASQVVSRAAANSDDDDEDGDDDEPPIGPN